MYTCLVKWYYCQISIIQKIVIRVVIKLNIIKLFVTCFWVLSITRRQSTCRTYFLPFRILSAGHSGQLSRALPLFCSFYPAHLFNYFQVSIITFSFSVTFTNTKKQNCCTPPYTQLPISVFEPFSSLSDSKHKVRFVDELKGF